MDVVSALTALVSWRKRLIRAKVRSTIRLCTPTFWLVSTPRRTVRIVTPQRRRGLAAMSMVAGHREAILWRGRPRSGMVVGVKLVRLALFSRLAFLPIDGMLSSRSSNGRPRWC